MTNWWCFGWFLLHLFNVNYSQTGLHLHPYTPPYDRSICLSSKRGDGSHVLAHAGDQLGETFLLVDDLGQCQKFTASHVWLQDLHREENMWLGRVQTRSVER